MEVLVFFGILIGGVYLYRVSVNNNRREKALSELISQPGFLCDEYLISSDDSVILGIDKSNGKLGVWIENKVKVYDSNSIGSCEILVNDIGRTSKSILSVWGRYYSRKLVFGQAKAVVSALTGPETNEKLITSVALKVVLRDFDIPFVVVSLFKGNGTKDYDFSLAFQWESYLKNLSN